MWQEIAAWQEVEIIIILEHVVNRRCIQVGVPTNTTGERARVLMRAKHTPKVGVENIFEILA